MGTTNCSGARSKLPEIPAEAREAGRRRLLETRVALYTMLLYMMYVFSMQKRGSEGIYFLVRKAPVALPLLRFLSAVGLCMLVYMQFTKTVEVPGRNDKSNLSSVVAATSRTDPATMSSCKAYCRFTCVYILICSLADIMMEANFVLLTAYASRSPARQKGGMSPSVSNSHVDSSFVDFLYSPTFMGLEIRNARLLYTTIETISLSLLYSLPILCVTLRALSSSYMLAGMISLSSSRNWRRCSEFSKEVACAAALSISVYTMYAAFSVVYLPSNKVMVPSNYLRFMATTFTCLCGIHVFLSAVSAGVALRISSNTLQISTLCIIAPLLLLMSSLTAASSYMMQSISMKTNLFTVGSASLTFLPLPVGDYLQVLASVIHTWFTGASLFALTHSVTPVLSRMVSIRADEERKSA
eukprot:GHVU01157180.1.p1 GENE.GHVU01157180.1~~GHVU01157180.1.p1  ORF type:complete len:412 (-),score=7.97 GHVU01157180.1:1276-2511(-)